jgi:hypothetical protein
VDVDPGYTGYPSLAGEIPVSTRMLVALIHHHADSSSTPIPTPVSGKVSVAFVGALQTGQYPTVLSD